MSSSAELPGFATSVPVTSTVKPKSILKTTSSFAKKAEQQKTEKEILAKWTKPRENKRNQNSNGTGLAKLPPVRTAADPHAGSAATAFVVASPPQLKAAAAAADQVGPFHLPAAAEPLRNAATAVSGHTTTTANSVNSNRTDNNRKRAAVDAPARIVVDAGTVPGSPEIAVAIPRHQRASTNTMTRPSTSESTAEFPGTAQPPPPPPRPATMAAPVGIKNLKPPPFAAMGMSMEQDDEDDPKSQAIVMEKVISQHMAHTRECENNSLVVSLTEVPGGEDEGSKKPAARIVARPTLQQQQQRQPSLPQVAPSSGGKSREDLAAIIFGKKHTIGAASNLSPSLNLSEDVSATTTTPCKAEDEETTAEITPRRAFRRTARKTAGGYGPPPKQGRDAAPAGAANAGATIQVTAGQDSKASSETFQIARTDETTTTTPHKRQKQARKRVVVDNSPEAAKKFADWAVDVRCRVATTSKPKAKVAPPKPPSASRGRALPPAEEIWSGTPDDDIGVDWTGWTKKTFRRQSGKTAGTTDSYWYTPKTNKKLRSLKEVLRFVDFLQQVNADEALAWLKLKEKTK